MNKENMIKYVVWAKENLSDDKLDMLHYSTGDHYALEPENICGTSACFLGWTPKYFGAEGLPRIEGGICWNRISDHFFGINRLSEEWSWLFDAFWPDSVEQAIKRMEYLIENDTPPEIWDYEYTL